MSRLIKILALAITGFGIVAVLCVGVIIVVGGDSISETLRTEWLRFQVSRRDDDLNRPMSNNATPIRFRVEVGDTPGIIAQRLALNNLISDADLFVDYVRITNLDTQLEAGVYFLNQTQTIPDIAVALTDSASSVIPFRILEGWRLEEVAQAIDQSNFFDFTGADFLAVTRAGANFDADFAAQIGLPPGVSLEGFMYPDTYQLPAEVTPVMLRDILLETFREKVGTQLIADAAAQGLTMYEVVTLASIIEREAVHNDEHPLIASVYRNRLANGLKLDADPTVQYAIGFKDNTWWPQITVEDYSNVISAYNTYLNTDLPPGPIANPGIDAIRAAVYPAESPYIYFRAMCDGSGYHNFAITFDEHLANGC